MNIETDKPVNKSGTALEGIRGWLILPAIGLVASPILGVLSLVTGYALYSEVAAIGFGTVYAAGGIIECGLVLFVIYAASRFFRKKRDAPLVIIVLLILGVAAYGLILLLELSQGAEDFAAVTTKMLWRSIINAVIWIPYFKISKRVKATFVN